MAKALKQPRTKRPNGYANPVAKKVPAGRPTLSPYLYLNPLGSYPNFTWGVLRRKFGPDGRENTAEEFGRLKLHPVNPPAAGAAWRSPCRWMVLLPEDASDSLWDPQRLLASFDANAVPWVPEILAYITVRFESPRLHVVWDRVQRWARESLVSRGLPVVGVLHVPAEVGSPNLPHIHLLVPVRTLGATGHGWGVYDQEMSHDEGQELTWRSWTEFNAR